MNNTNTARKLDELETPSPRPETARQHKPLDEGARFEAPLIANDPLGLGTHPLGADADDYHTLHEALRLRGRHVYLLDLDTLQTA